MPPTSSSSSSGPRKRPAAAPLSNSSVVARKRPRTSGGGAKRVKQDPDAVRSDGGGGGEEDKAFLRDRFLKLLADPRYRSEGMSNHDLTSEFGPRNAAVMVKIVNELLEDSRLNAERSGDGLVYRLVGEDVAARVRELDETGRDVYRTIEAAGNLGIWTKDIKRKTNLHIQTINKTIKALESRRLIKPVRSVNSKTKNLYMLYNLTPAEEITGGPWYTDQQFDHEFINGLRKFILMCCKKLNKGRGVTLVQISNKMKQANVSKIPLDLDKVQQLVQSLAFDYMVEQSGVTISGEALFVQSQKISLPCGFRNWAEVLCDDFCFRRIAYEDGVTLAAHEPHHQS